MLLLMLHQLLLHVTAGQAESIRYACTWRHSCTRRNQHGLLLLVFARQPRRCLLAKYMLLLLLVLLVLVL